MLKMISGLLAGLLSFVTKRPSPQPALRKPDADPMVACPQLRLWLWISDYQGPSIKIIDGPLAIGSLHNAFSEIEVHGQRVSKVFMNAREYHDIFRRLVDDLDQAPRTGVKLWGVDVIVSRSVAPGTVHVCAAAAKYSHFRYSI